MRLRGHDWVRVRVTYSVCCIDEVKQSQDGDRDPYSRPVDHGDQRLREVDVSLHVLTVQIGHRQQAVESAASSVTVTRDRVTL